MLQFSPKTLKTISTGLEKVPPYKTVNNSEPPVRRAPATTLPKIETQRNRDVLHTLVRTNVDGSRPSVTSQATAMFNGFQSCITPLMQKSKPYYHLTYPVPPSKSVCYDVMLKLSHAIEAKNRPFAFLVGDFPTFLLFLKLKSENGVLFAKIIPHLGPFHMHKSYLSAINKRFAGSELSDILVAAGAIVSGSIDQALRGGHYKRALSGHFLLREALNVFLIQQGNLNLDETEKSKIEVLRNRANETRETLKETHDELLAT